MNLLIRSKSSLLVSLGNERPTQDSGVVLLSMHTSLNFEHSPQHRNFLNKVMRWTVCSHLPTQMQVNTNDMHDMSQNLSFLHVRPASYSPYSPFSLEKCRCRFLEVCSDQ